MDRDKEIVDRVAIIQTLTEGDTEVVAAGVTPSVGSFLALSVLLSVGMS